MDSLHDLLARLHRGEAARMIAVLAKAFGLAHIEVAEDAVSETFLAATEAWPKSGLPANPAGWLYVAARHKMLEHLRRQKVFAEKVAPGVRYEAPAYELPDAGFSVDNIQDSQLRMLFAVCHPSLAGEAQIGLALRILCGFSLDEIAEAFLSNREAISKRLYRARERLRTEGISLELPAGPELQTRLEVVLHILYLLFNEGFYSSSQNDVLRKDLCLEAMRLCKMLTEVPTTDTPAASALLALMCYHSSRFEARQASNQGFVLYEDQDEALWSQDLIRQGHAYLDHSAAGQQLSAYHIEAAIARAHCRTKDSPGKWDEVLRLYNQLLQVRYTPMAALNRAYALYKAQGPQEALAEALKLGLESSPFYHTLLGELYLHIDSAKARESLTRALALARTDWDRQNINSRLHQL